MKKLLLIIALTIFGLGLNAQNVGDVTYIDYDGYSLEIEITSVSPAECKVSGHKGILLEVTIPSTVTISGIEFAVTSIGSSAFLQCLAMTSIEIPNSVTSIGDYAFVTSYSDYSSLTSVTFGENSQLTSIGDYAFYDSPIDSIEIPNSVTSIGDGAFSRCTLHSIEIPNSVTSIGDYTFYECMWLTSIEIPNSVTSIGYAAFYDCYRLTSITFGDNPQLTSIGNYAFCIEELWSDRTSLTSIEIPNSVTSIGDYAFSYCSSLTSITFGDNPQLTSIGNSAFSVCSSLTSIEIPNSVTSIGNSAFASCESLTSIEIPNSVTSIGDGAFLHCESLTSIEIPNSVTSIGDWAFYYCSSLTSIEIPNSVTFIGEEAFYYCSSLTSITFGDNPQLTSIGERAFYYCESLTSIEIPNSVTSIGDYAFYDCDGLEVIKCYAEDVPETGGYSVFSNCPLDMIIYVPEVSLEDYKATYPWNKFTILPLNDEENDPLDAPENLVAEVLSTSSIILTWDNVENALSYNVYQANELITNIEETTFTVDGLEYNTEYCYTVTAVRNDEESDKSEEKCAKTLGESINELLFSSINIYPNPVEDELFIATEVRVKEIAIYDVYGRQTMSQQVNETTSQQVVKVADLDAGVYFVNIKTENGNIVKRFVKK